MFFIFFWNVFTSMAETNAVADPGFTNGRSRTRGPKALKGEGEGVSPPH